MFLVSINLYKDTSSIEYLRKCINHVVLKKMYFITETTEVKLGVVVTFRKNISLTNYDRVVQTMESSVN